MRNRTRWKFTYRTVSLVMLNCLKIIFQEKDDDLLSPLRRGVKEEVMERPALDNSQSRFLPSPFLKGSSQGWLRSKLKISFYLPEYLIWYKIKRQNTLFLISSSYSILILKIILIKANQIHHKKTIKWYSRIWKED